MANGNRAQIIEVINRNSFVSLALANGFNAFLPVYDGGIDLVLHKPRDEFSGEPEVVRKVQLKGRWTIDRKYIGRDLWVAFPIAGEWYLMQHDEMVRSAHVDGATRTRSWQVDGLYSRGRPSKAVVASCAAYRFGGTDDLQDETPLEADLEPDEASDSAGRPGALSLNDRILGSMLAGAVGDALGAPIEFLTLNEIRERFGPDGLSAYAPAYGRVGAITDDTQMTLFTAEGLMRAAVRSRKKGMCHPPSIVRHAYRRWLLTQGEHPSDENEIGTDGWLFAVEALHHRRGPGNTCLGALRGDHGWGGGVAANDSKGCGGVMRAAPVGLLAPVLGDDARVFELACELARITHGHPSGYLAAGYLAVVVAAILREMTLPQALDAADQIIRTQDARSEVSAAIDRARALAGRGRPRPEDIETLGGGWVAEEALAIAVCCALSCEDVADGLLLAANHSGDSDSTASITGNILGAMHGLRAIPEPLLEDLELRDEITKVAVDLAITATGGEVTWDDYPGW